MKNLLWAVVIIVVLIAAVGVWRGWFEFGAKKGQGEAGANVNVNVNKFKQDKENFRKYLAEKSKAMKEKLAGLTDKAKTLSGDAKAKLEKEIEDLTKKHTNLEAKAKAVDESTEENFHGLMKAVKGELEPPEGEGKGSKPDKPD
jgi:hypothetical protein